MSILKPDGHLVDSSYNERPCREGPFGHRMSTSGSIAEPEKLNSSPASDASVATVATVNFKKLFCGVTGTPTSSDISRKNI